MEISSLGPIDGVSRLTLGGGGIGQVWGSTDRSEAIATVRAAFDRGVTCFDMAPLYGDGEAETVLGLAFEGRYPAATRVTTKCMLGNTPAEAVEQVLTESLDASCKRLQRDFVDVFILHGYVVPDDASDLLRPEILERIGVPESRFFEHVVPVFEALKSAGRIGAWGLTAASTQKQNLNVIDAETGPDIVQCIANLLDSPGGMAITREPADPRAVIAAAAASGIGVMGIRAVAAGSLTGALDRELPERSPEMRDWNRAAPFRELAARIGETPSFLAHQYALSMPGVDTVVLGVKNRAELDECLRAEASGPLDPDVIDSIDRAVSG